MRPPVTDTAYCAECGAAAAADTIERFGERFCSADHAEQFVSAVRASRLAEAARRDAGTAACQLPMAGAASWKQRLKRSACWAAPLLILLAIPLLWSGSAVAVAGGSALSLLAALACPVAMFFMMRAMMAPQHRDARSDQAPTPDDAAKEDRHA